MKGDRDAVLDGAAAVQAEADFLRGAQEQRQRTVLQLQVNATATYGPSPAAPNAGACSSDEIAMKQTGMRGCLQEQLIDAARREQQAQALLRQVLQRRESGEHLPKEAPGQAPSRSPAHHGTSANATHAVSVTLNHWG